MKGAGLREAQVVALMAYSRIHDGMKRLPPEAYDA